VPQRAVIKCKASMKFKASTRWNENHTSARSYVSMTDLVLILSLSTAGLVRC